ncbi:MAG: DNA replication/repair protein RecF [Rhodobacteraceae bacterium]|nr:DNA replication/repair protein RecF [Paracoccaceae bacterium]
MPHVSELELRNFRSFGLCRIEASPRPIILHGGNGRGKTSVLEAISLCSPGRGLRFATSGDICRRGQKDGWLARFSVADRIATYSIDTYAARGERRQIRIDGKPARQLDLLDQLRVVWLSPLMDRIWVDGAGVRRRFMDRATMSFSPEHPTLINRYERAMRERNRLLRQHCADESWFEALEFQMADSGAVIRANRQSAIDSLQCSIDEGSGRDLPAATLEITMPEATASAADADSLLQLFRTGRHRDMMAKRTLNGPHRADLSVVHAQTQLPARLCSSGEQKELLLTVVVAHAQAVHDRFGQRPVLLLDEAVAHLDVDRRATLLNRICKTPAQIWLTGTDLASFESVQQDCQVVDMATAGGGACGIARTSE